MIKLAKSLCVYLSFVVLAFSFFSLNPVDAQLPEVLTDNTDTPINPGRTEPFYVFFPYGDPALDYPVKNVSLQVSVNDPETNAPSESLIISKDNVYDIYSSDPEKVVKCEDTNARGYQINSELVNVPYELVYGPFTANDAANVSGKRGGNLSPKQTGCLKVGLEVTNRSADSELVDITIKPVSTVDNNDQYYKEGDAPAVKTIRLMIGGDNRCEDGNEFFEGQCLPICDEGQVRDTSGNCLITVKECPDTQELFENNCVDKCVGDEARSPFGTCRQKARNYNREASIVFSVVLVGFILVLALSFLNAIFNRKKKSKKL